MINHYELFQFHAIGRAIVACPELENTLRGIWVKYHRPNPNEKFSDDDKKDFKKAIDSEICKLEKYVLREVSEQNTSSDDMMLIKNYLSPLEDKFRDKFSTFRRWRNTLCHGRYRLETDGTISLFFWDKRALAKGATPDEVVFNGAIEGTYDLQTMMKLSNDLFRLNHVLHNSFNLGQHVSDKQIP